MATILLIRHAEHEVGMNTLVGRSPRVRLSELGKSQAADLSRRLADLPIDAIYASPLERTIETATAVAEPHELEVQSSEELLEVDFGQWTGMTFQQLREREDWRRWNAARSVSSAPGGEFMLTAQQRAVPFLADVAQKHEGQCIAAVSHGDIIRAATAYFLGVNLDNFLRIEVSLASVTVIRLARESVRVVCVNSSEPVRLEA